MGMPVTFLENPSPMCLKKSKSVTFSAWQMASITEEKVLARFCGMTCTKSFLLPRVCALGLFVLRQKLFVLLLTVPQTLLPYCSQLLFQHVLMEKIRIPILRCWQKTNPYFVAPVTPGTD